MKYEIFGGTLPAVTITLDAGESIYTQSGGMSWMSRGIRMETNMKGGLLKGLGRMLSVESLFMATYTASAPGQQITIASGFPESIVALDCSGGREYICQKNAFLCAQPGVTVSAYVVKGMRAGFFGGEGFILQKLSGEGLAFVEIDGTACEKVLGVGEELIVDTGNVAIFEANVNYSVEMVKGFANVLFGGEGLFLTTLTGPGRVWLQTLSLPDFASRIISFMPNKK